ncbi:MULTISPECIES: Tn3 family transposase [Brevibacillus]|uniref:Tn3 family transposase n=1 Tax=Brevibacillus sp. AY1 TaxID=2807621 RepID=UPI00160623AC|nr:MULTISPECIES: Tn3 family transposase [Brevibacillus]MDH4619336.1 Tn3 family transposase [Brevibacillus sp. AY1]
MKRVSAGEHGESYKDLLYVRRKFIHKDNLRNAISEVVNAIFRVRMQEIWGNTTSSCAFWYDFLARHMLSDCGVEQVYEDFCNNWE